MNELFTTLVFCDFVFGLRVKVLAAYRDYRAQRRLLQRMRTLSVPKPVLRQQIAATRRARRHYVVHRDLLGMVLREMRN